MARFIFISYAGEDTNQARGFRLLRWNNNVDVEFFDRHLLSPVDSENKDYIRRAIREKMTGTSLTVVLIGEHTAKSEWVDWEIRETLENKKGVLGIYLKGQEGSPIPQALKDAGAEVIPWEPSKFNEAMERCTSAPRTVGAYIPGTDLVGCAR